MKATILLFSLTFSFFSFAQKDPVERIWMTAAATAAATAHSKCGRWQAGWTVVVGQWQRRWRRRRRTAPGGGGSGRRLWSWMRQGAPTVSGFYCGQQWRRRRQWPWQRWR